MNPTDLNALMHTVLDGEATPDEARELHRLLAADPAARARFDDLKQLFDGLRAVPKAYPPEGLVAAVISRLPPSSTRRRESDQLSLQSGVIRQAFTESEIRGRIPGQSDEVHRLSEQGPSFRGENMSEQKIGSKRKIWIGVSIAVAAVVVASQYVDFPPGGKDVSGTIAPAQRYRAEQPGAADVKLGGTTATASSPDAAGAAASGVGQAGGANLSGKGGDQSGGVGLSGKGGDQSGGVGLSGKGGDQSGGVGLSGKGGDQSGGVGLSGKGGDQSGAGISKN